MSKNSCVAAEKHRRCVLRMARAELLHIFSISIHIPIQSHCESANRHNIHPHMLEELPPEIPRPDPFSFTVDPGYHCEYLFLRHRPLYLLLCITNNIIPFRLNSAYTVHNVLTIRALIEYHIAFLKFPVWFLEADGIPLMNQERRHTVTCNYHTDVFSILRQFP